MYKDIEEFIRVLKAYVEHEATYCELKQVFQGLDRFHDFHHYLSDLDIREKDNAYKEMQEKELAKFIVFLENGDFESANQLTFLSAKNN